MKVYEIPLTLAEHDSYIIYFYTGKDYNDENDVQLSLWHENLLI